MGMISSYDFVFLPIRFGFSSILDSRDTRIVPAVGNTSHTMNLDLCLFLYLKIIFLKILEKYSLSFRNHIMRGERTTPRGGGVFYIEKGVVALLHAI